MNKGEFVSELAKRTDLSVNKSNEVLKEIETIIKEELQRGGEINFTGFMSFKSVVRAAKKGRNPQTGEELIIPETRTAKVKIGKTLKKALN